MQESEKNILNPPVIGMQAFAGWTEEELKHGVFRLEKYRDGESVPYEVKEWQNAYVNSGGALFLDLLIGAGGTAFNNGNAYLGVGDSSTATTVSMTDLQASTNKLRKAMDATYPSRSGQTVTWRATFASADANFAWQEGALFNASSGGTMLARGVQSLGTKVSGTSWTLIYTITIP